MRKRLVGIRHSVRIFLLLDGVSAVVRCIKNLRRQAIGHRLLAATARIGNDPTNRQRAASFLVNFDRHLISRTAHSSRLNFNGWLDVVDSALENLERLFAGLLANSASWHRRK